MYIYIGIDRYTFLSHIAVYMKLTQHCKLTILQFFKKDEKKVPRTCSLLLPSAFFPIVIPVSSFLTGITTGFWSESYREPG